MHELHEVYELKPLDEGVHEVRLRGPGSVQRLVHARRDRKTQMVEVQQVAQDYRQHRGRGSRASAREAIESRSP